MKKNIFLLMALFAFMSASIIAAVPTDLHIQGHINDNAGEPIQGSATIVFRLYDNATIVTAVHVHPAITVNLVDGYFLLSIDGVPEIVNLAKNNL
jgi:hypothetical protein